MIIQLGGKVDNHHTYLDEFNWILKDALKFSKGEKKKKSGQFFFQKELHAQEFKRLKQL